MTMTNEQAMELGRRAVACVPIERWPDWTPVVHVWTDGETSEGLILRTLDDDGRAFVFEIMDTVDLDDTETLPLLNTPAGLGSLLAVVREAWAEHCGEDVNVFVWWCEDYNPSGIASMCQDAGFVCQAQNVDDYGAVLWRPKRTSNSRAEALVSALEAAP